MYWATSQPDSAAATRATPAAWPVAMAVRAFTWKKTRSTTTASGRNSATRARSSSDRVRSRSGRGMRGRRRDHPAGHGGQAAVAPGHHAVAAARQSGVDPEDEHAFDGTRAGGRTG